MSADALFGMVAIIVILLLAIGFLIRWKSYRNCPACRWPNPSDALYCTNCGYDLKTKRESEQQF